MLIKRLLSCALAVVLTTPPALAYNPMVKRQELTVDPPVDVRQAFGGNTISVIVFRSYAVPQKDAATFNSAGRLVLHAFLNTDGAARVKLWDEPSGKWQAPVSERWTAEGEVFCLTAANLKLGAEKVCMETIVWKEVFSGTSVAGGGIDFMAKGNIIPGNPERM